ncbi:hypothetical protein EC968_004935 [Mortierella alpina]|nr:hypothetical protein EC968_004935 [Mortierella alpina]
MSQTGLRVNITGIPLQGAKSRVETQIKLGIQLVNQQNERVGAWTHIKLPEYMVAKEKNKRINAKNVGPEVYEALNNGTCLNLEASVVCQSDQSKVIQTCTGCVLRERKRAQRKKSLGKKKTATPGPITQLDEDDPEQIALEQRKILLFNCTEIAEFNSGELILPTRITCYCRHHSEKQGFCIQFMLRDYANNVVAMGMSPPIMITDDHKASKVKKPEQGATGTQRKTTTTNKPTEGASKVITLTPPSSPTTPGDEVESEVDMGTGQDDDDEEEEEFEESEMDSASSNASPSPLQATMDINHYNPNSMSIVDLISQFSQGDDARQVPSPSSPLTPGDRMSQACQTTPASEYPPTSFEGQQQFQSMNSFIYASSNDRMVPEQLVDIPISLAAPTSSPMDQMRDHVSQQHQLQQEHERQQHQHQLQQLQQQHLQFQQLQQQALFPDSFNNPAAVTPAPIGRRTSTSGGVGPVRRRRAPAAANPLTSSATQPVMSAPMTTNPLATTASMISPSPLPSLLGLSSSLAMVPPGFILPRMTRLIPNSGPCFGGIEITVLGANFYAGLTAMFDSTPALPTQFWSPNTLICILPPRIQPGTTVVTFKEHPSIALPQSGDNSELMLFTYVDESDKALMELALQVVGLKMTGRLEDARNIALRIVGSQVANGQQQQGQQQGQDQGQGQGQQQNTMNYANLVRDLILSFGDQETNSEFEAGLEDRILTLLTVLSELPEGGQGVLNLARRDTGHRLLHFGAMKGFERLVEVLVSHADIEVDALDMNGYSALHYACWRGEVGSASLLVGKGADVMLRSVHGVGCLDLAGMNPPTKAAELIQALRTSNSWVDAGAQEADDYESAQEAEGDSEVDEELEALDALEDGEDSGVWLEHFATESDVLEEEDESEDSFDATSLVGSEIEDLPWLDKGEWIGEEVSDSSQWSGSDAGKNENECEKEECTLTADTKPNTADIVQAPSSPSLIPMATPLPQDPKDAQAAEMGTNWLQKTLFQLQSSSPAFDFEFFKALNQILPEKGNFLMNMPSMPTSIQAFNANIGTYMPYNFSGKHDMATTDAAAQPVSEKQAYVHQRSGSIGEPILDEQAISHELWTLHSGPDNRLMNNNVTATPASAVASTPEEVPSRYLNVYHEPFSATSVLQQPVNSYALPAQDSSYNPLTLTTAPLPNTHGSATVTSPLSKVRRFYPPMGSEPQQPSPASDVGESSVVRGGRRIITEIVNNGAVVGGAAVAERAVEAVGENRHIQELRARYHQKMKRLKKDKMLFLFWVPVLLVMLALTIIRIASTFDVARQWTGGLMNLAGIQV